MCDDLDTCMPCYESFRFSPIVACNISNNFSFIFVACNDDKMLDNEFAPIAFSNFGDSSFCHVENFPLICILTTHICHTFLLILVCLVMCKWIDAS